MHIWKHFQTITRHRHAVLRHCFRAGIGLQGLTHDLSKYSPAEFWTAAKYYQGDRSPNDREREEKGYSAVWMHHKGRNRHHYEYWTDYSLQTRRPAPVKMPLRYVVEMFCDRVAACKIYQGPRYTAESPWNYFLRIRGQGLMHPETEALLETLLQMLRDKGEAETFRYIRTQLLHRGSYGAAQK